MNRSSLFFFAAALSWVSLLTLPACLDYGDVQVRFDNEVPAEVPTRIAVNAAGDEVTLVRAAINGADLGWFMLVSASYYCIVDAKYLDRIDRPSLVTESEIPYPCKLPVRVFRAGELSVGRLTLKNVDFAVFDISSMIADQDEEIVGVIGYPVFAHAVVVVDYGDEDRVSIASPQQFQLPGGTWKPLGVYNFQPVVQARVNRSHTAPFVVDTGYSRAVSFYSVFTANHDVLEGGTTETRAIDTVCGPSTERLGRVRVFEFLDRTYTDVAVSIQEPGSVTDVAPGRMGGGIGRKMLEAFTVVMDVPNGRIALIDKDGE